MTPRYWIYDYNKIYEPVGTNNQVIAETFARKEGVLVIDMEKKQWFVGDVIRGGCLLVRDIKDYSEFEEEVRECLASHGLLEE